MSVIAFLFILRYLNSRNRIDYDDIKQVLYVVNEKENTEVEIPVDRIDKILYSAIGFSQGYRSYIIIYRDLTNQKNKIRLFPIYFDKSIETIKIDAKLKNPNLVTRNWTIGWNELFD